MNSSTRQGQSTQQQAAGLLCAVTMTVAMLLGTNALATAPAAHAPLHAATHTVVTPA